MACLVKHMDGSYYMGWTKFNAPMFGGRKEEAYEFKSKEHAIVFMQNHTHGLCYPFVNCIPIERIRKEDKT